MNRDTSKSFREIHGSAEALKSVLTQLEAMSIEKTDDTRYDAVPLRFLTLMKPDPADDGKTVHLRLTPLSEETSKSVDYYAVSYTWSQPEDIGQVLNPPKYVIHSDGGTRPPACPLPVLHRAWDFAQEDYRVRREYFEVHTDNNNGVLDRGSAYLWIDQECIIQDDPHDVENHLQVMNKVYEHAHTTVAVLSEVIASGHILNHVWKAPGVTGRDSIWYLPDHGPLIENLTDCRALLENITRDRWFTRTWTFHEKQCAGGVSHDQMCYLLHVTSDEKHSPGSYYNVCVEERIFFSLRLASTKPMLTQVSDSFMLGLVSSDANAEYETCPSDAALDNGIIASLLKDFFTPQEDESILERMEKCKNLIVSDRLAIFANIEDYDFILPTRSAEQCTTSYSTCLLALLLMNSNKFDQPPILPLSGTEGRFSECWIKLLDALLDLTIVEIPEFLKSNGFYQDDSDDSYGSYFSDNLGDFDSEEDYEYETGREEDCNDEIGSEEDYEDDAGSGKNYEDVEGLPATKDEMDPQGGGDSEVEEIPRNKAQLWDGKSVRGDMEVLHGIYMNAVNLCSRFQNLPGPRCPESRDTENSYDKEESGSEEHAREEEEKEEGEECQERAEPQDESDSKNPHTESISQPIGPLQPEDHMIANLFNACLSLFGMHDLSRRRLRGMVSPRRFHSGKFYYRHRDFIESGVCEGGKETMPKG